MLREHYRRTFGLTAAQMDDEPAEEVEVMRLIWAEQRKQEDRERLRAEQRGK